MTRVIANPSTQPATAGPAGLVARRFGTQQNKFLIPDGEQFLTARPAELALCSHRSFDMQELQE